MTSGWSRRASWGKRILWWTNHGTCTTREQLLLRKSSFSGCWLEFAFLPLSGGGTWRCRVWTFQPHWLSFPPSPVRRPSKSLKRRALTRPLWWMSRGECPAGHWILSQCLQSCWWCVHVSLCVQIGPWNGDFGKHVGQYSGRENPAVWPSQQSSLQTVQTG